MLDDNHCTTSRSVIIILLQNEEELTEVWSHVSEFENSESCVVQQQIPVRFYIMFLLTWQSLFKVSDSGMNILFLFLAMFLSLIISAIPCAKLQNFVKVLPRNITAAKKMVGLNTDLFRKYVRCPKCHSLYSLELCKITLPNKTVVSHKCSYVQFPHHPHRRQRSPCNTVLMKTIRTSAGTTSLYPRQMFCYRSLICSLQNLFSHPGFYEKTELWRKCHKTPGTLIDIYDGRVWNEFLNPQGRQFLSLPYNLALTLNIDWFQPFKHTTYSVGAIYLSIQNLPRTERYITDNAILVGIMPGPKEPKKNVNTYLQPLVNELKELWTGVPMKSASGVRVIVRAALICISCDIPATRKVSGFVGHSAYRACSRCLKAFQTENFGEKADYTGTDRSSWPPRSLQSHRENAHKHKEAKTQAEQMKIEREHAYGCRYSVILELPYFDVVRYSVIDPMHNLLLGTAKRFLSVWISEGLLETAHMESIQSKVDSFITPSDVGRIPSKIASGFSGFTAEQWRNWALIYSLFSLKGVLPHRHYDC